MNSEAKVLALDTVDESAIRSIISEFANTWNRHDMRAMHELNTDDAEWINIAGNYWRGNSNVYKGHDTIHRTIFAKTDMSLVYILVRAIAPEVAIAVATMIFDPVMMPTGEVLRELKTRGSFILVMRDGTWKITHFHNTTVNLEAERNDPLSWDGTGYLPGRGEE